MKCLCLFIACVVMCGAGPSVKVLDVEPCQNGMVLDFYSDVEGFITPDGLSVIQIEISEFEIKENGFVKLWVFQSDDIWNFDVPPTPYSADSYYLCPDSREFGDCVEKADDFDGNILSVQLDMEDGYYLIFAELLGINGERLYEFSDKIVFSVGRSRFDERTIELIHEKELRSEKFQNEVQSLRDIAMEQFSPSNSTLYSFSEDIFDPLFLSAIQSGDKVEILSILTKISNNSEIYTFPLFTQEFSASLIEELAHIENTVENINRPNSMNNYGLILDEYGFYPMIQKIVSEYIQPLSYLIFREWNIEKLDSHHAFVVEYQIGKDEHLDYHMDQSAVTINIGLTNNFEGGYVYFNGMRGTPQENIENLKVQVRAGTAIFHIGQHWHGAEKITKGERKNLIIWCRSSDTTKSPKELYHDQCNQ